MERVNPCEKCCERSNLEQFKIKTLKSQLTAANGQLAECREALRSLRQVNASDEDIIDKLTELYWEEHCQGKYCEVEDCLRCILTKAKGG